MYRTKDRLSNGEPSLFLHVQYNDTFGMWEEHEVVETIELMSKEIVTQQVRKKDKELTVFFGKTPLGRGVSHTWNLIRRELRDRKHDFYALWNSFSVCLNPYKHLTMCKAHDWVDNLLDDHSSLRQEGLASVSGATKTLHAPKPLDEGHEDEDEEGEYSLFQSDEEDESWDDDFFDYEDDIDDGT